jgi:hypothetical protein
MIRWNGAPLGVDDSSSSFRMILFHPFFTASSPWSDRSIGYLPLCARRCHFETTGTLSSSCWDLRHASVKNVVKNSPEQIVIPYVWALISMKVTDNNENTKSELEKYELPVH